MRIVRLINGSEILLNRIITNAGNEFAIVQMRECPEKPWISEQKFNITGQGEKKHILIKDEKVLIKEFEGLIDVHI